MKRLAREITLLLADHPEVIRDLWRALGPRRKAS